ncbi:MAG: hypothetical protein U0361_24395, partial [Nitrospiraceae bacterium]
MRNLRRETGWAKRWEHPKQKSELGQQGGSEPRGFARRKRITSPVDVARLTQYKSTSSRLTGRLTGPKNAGHALLKNDFSRASHSVIRCPPLHCANHRHPKPLPQARS